MKRVTSGLPYPAEGYGSGPRELAPQVLTDEASRFDFAFFALVLAFTLLYNLQLLAPLLSSLFVRQALIVVLYMRLIVRTRSLTFGTPRIFLVFLGLSVVVMLHTAIAFDWHLAILGFVRFLNVAILAPLAVALVTSEARLRTLFVLWFAAIGLGLATDLYQVFGGQMDWLVQGYVSGRCDLPRYKTILGEPNVGGMAAAIAAIGAFLLFRPLWLRIAAVGLSIVFVILSLSRAALLMVVIGALLAAVLEGRRVRQAWQRPGAGWRVAAALFAIAVGSVAADQVPGIHAYFATTVASFTGNCAIVSNDINDLGTYYGKEDDILFALRDRAFDRVGLGLSLMGSAAEAADMLRRLFVGLFGLSFGVAGSVAVDLRGSPPAFLPHNGFLELLLVGGPALLASFVALVAQAGRRLVLLRWDRSSPMLTFMLVIYPMLVLATMGYPVFYHPVLGVPFWLIVAAAVDPRRGALRTIGAGAVADMASVRKFGPAL